MTSAVYLANSTIAFRITSRIRTVGRDPESDIVLEHESVSRNHARIWREGSGVHVEDLDSRNGTFVNDVKVIQFATMEIDDYVLFAQCMFRLVDRERVRSSGSTSELGNGSTMYQMLSLSKSQRRVMKYLLRGRAEKEIAKSLNISPHTVHCHVRAIYQAFQVGTRAELMSKFIDRLSSPDLDLGITKRNDQNKS